MSHKRIVVSFSLIVVLALLLIVSASWAFTQPTDTTITPEFLYYVRSYYTIPPNTTAGQIAWCEPGDVVISGGYEISPWGSLEFDIKLNRPSKTGQQNWEAGGTNWSEVDVEITVIAICLAHTENTYLPEVSN